MLDDVPGVFSPSLARLIGVEQSIGAAGAELKAAILAAEDALQRIRREFNRDVRDRLDQVDAIVVNALEKIDVLRQEGIKDANELMKRADQILARTAADARSLEKTIKEDLSTLIFEAECSIKRTIQETVPETFGGIARVFGGNEIVITPPVLYKGEKRWFCIGDCRIQTEFRISQPYSETYFAVRDYLLQRLDQMPDDGPINTVVSTYEFLGAFARRAACFVPGSEQRYIAEHMDFRDVASAWTTLLGDDLGMGR
ncbi:hypothetical protein [Mesorhizobium prunaredense]|uniref:hypothetical protein n=1 Tax=Mesorhizobium prunaredense TaxID=1631249 RepID=UPI00117E3567|nr:hypothetical protein [Mesorhizobium prunaredense]